MPHLQQSGTGAKDDACTFARSSDRAEVVQRGDDNAIDARCKVSSSPTKAEEWRSLVTSSTNKAAKVSSCDWQYSSNTDISANRRALLLRVSRRNP